MRCGECNKNRERYMKEQRKVEEETTAAQLKNIVGIGRRGGGGEEQLLIN